MFGPQKEWAGLWDRLVLARRRKEEGLSGATVQPYYVPPNVFQSAPAKNRKDYFDSRKQVLKYLQGKGCAGGACEGCRVCTIGLATGTAGRGCASVMVSDKLGPAFPKSKGHDETELGLEAAGAATSVPDASDITVAAASPIVFRVGVAGAASCTVGGAECTGKSASDENHCDGGACGKHGSLIETAALVNAGAVDNETGTVVLASSPSTGRPVERRGVCMSELGSAQGVLGEANERHGVEAVGPIAADAVEAGVDSEVASGSPKMSDLHIPYFMGVLDKILADVRAEATKDAFF